MASLKIAPASRTAAAEDINPTNPLPVRLDWPQVHWLTAAIARQARQVSSCESPMLAESERRAWNCFLLSWAVQGLLGKTLDLRMVADLIPAMLSAVSESLELPE